MAGRLMKKSSKALPLVEVIAFVETLNEDGRDVSSVNIATLKSLGATIADSFSDEITHYISSNASAKRLKAAAIFEITVVNPSWIESCRLTGSRVTEDNFLIGPETQASSAVNSSATLSLPPANVVVHEGEDLQKTAKVGRGTGMAKITATAKTLPVNSIDEIKQQDLNKRMVKNVTENVKVVKGKSNAKSRKTLQNIDIFTEEEVIPSVDCESPDVLSDEEKKSEAIIPLPSFKEMKTVTLPTIMKSKRRSERICDNELSQEELKTPPAVDLDVSMPIVRTDVSVKMSVSNDNMCDYMAAGGVREQKNKGTAATALSATTKNSKAHGSDKELKKSVVQQTKKVVAMTKEDALQHTLHSNSSLSSGSSAGQSSSSSTGTFNQTGAIAIGKGGEGGVGVVSIGSSRMDDITNAKIVIAVSGFDEPGERATISSSLSQFIQAVNESTNTNTSSSSSSSSSSSKRSTEKNVPGPFAVLLDLEEDSFGLHCTHVILQSSSSKRSLRILLALARGTPIVTEEWFYASLSVQHWVDSAPYMHEHYTVQQLSRGIGKPQRTFLKLKFFVGMSTNPSQIFLETILSAAGGSIADTIQGAEYLIFGSRSDAEVWMEEQQQPKRKSAKKSISPKGIDSDSSAALSMAADGKVLTCRYICDCLEDGKLLPPSSTANHLITFQAEEEDEGERRERSRGDENKGSRKRTVESAPKDSRISWDTKDVEKSEVKRAVAKRRVAASLSHAVLEESVQVGRKRKLDDILVNSDDDGDDGGDDDGHVVKKGAKKVVKSSTVAPVRLKTAAALAAEKKVRDNVKDKEKDKVMVKGKDKEKEKAEVKVVSAPVSTTTSKRASKQSARNKDTEADVKEVSRKELESKTSNLNDSGKKGNGSGKGSDFPFTVPGSPVMAGKRRLSNSRVLDDSPPLCLSGSPSAPSSLERDSERKMRRGGASAVDKNRQMSAKDTSALSNASKKSGTVEAEVPAGKREAASNSNITSSNCTSSNKEVKTYGTAKALKIDIVATATAVSRNRIGLDHDGSDTDDGEGGSSKFSSPKGREDSPCW